MDLNKRKSHRVDEPADLGGADAAWSTVSAICKAAHTAKKRSDGHSPKRRNIDIRTHQCHHHCVEEAIAGFDWDEGNCSKFLKHGVSMEEVESLFLQPIVILPDEAHSGTETRFKAIGGGAAGRLIFLVFTIRERKGKQYIRPISARYMHRKEVRHYEKENPNI